MKKAILGVLALVILTTAIVISLPKSAHAYECRWVTICSSTGYPCRTVWVCEY